MDQTCLEFSNISFTSFWINACNYLSSMIDLFTRMHKIWPWNRQTLIQHQLGLPKSWIWINISAVNKYQTKLTSEYQMFTNFPQTYSEQNNKNSLFLAAAMSHELVQSRDTSTVTALSSQQSDLRTTLQNKLKNNERNAWGNTESSSRVKQETRPCYQIRQ